MSSGRSVPARNDDADAKRSGTSRAIRRVMEHGFLSPFLRAYIDTANGGSDPSPLRIAAFNNRRRDVSLCSVCHGMRVLPSFFPVLFTGFSVAALSLCRIFVGLFFFRFFRSRSQPSSTELADSSVTLLVLFFFWFPRFSFWVHRAESGMEFIRADCMASAKGLPIF